MMTASALGPSWQTTCLSATEQALAARVAAAAVAAAPAPLVALAELCWFSFGACRRSHRRARPARSLLSGSAGSSSPRCGPARRSARSSWRHRHAPLLPTCPGPAARCRNCSRRATPPSRAGKPEDRCQTTTLTTERPQRPQRMPMAAVPARPRAAPRPPPHRRRRCDGGCGCLLGIAPNCRSYCAKMCSGSSWWTNGRLWGCGRGSLCSGSGRSGARKSTRQMVKSWCS
mmetsp:Transcript_107372/g.346730  ORF Transcript_107372/g.346730 Transcript_107372/m.346730 type:complete len:230 (+) Transcript_107372:401-1090(+)